METAPKKTKRVSIRFLHRTIRFLWLCIFASFTLFIAGNRQFFSDESLFIILHVQILTGALLFLIASASFLLELHHVCIRRKKRYAILCVESFFSAFIGLCISVLSLVIVVLSAGTGTGAA